MSQKNDCVFCGEPREDKWQSHIAIIAKGQVLGELTVCPKCRKEHTVNELYGKVAELLAKAHEE